MSRTNNRVAYKQSAPGRTIGTIPGLRSVQVSEQDCPRPHSPIG
ncbi:hypothetical protein C7387_1634 [Yokenella regensburgei]|uniref:Uncharacterized protein n=1 Tax=Yokenella regensburgei TaxID=158877 RepID=A0ABX9S2M2_9ENTR|nr:hypothetical protein C7387_1634 [Yokenella regensburgei]